MIDPKVAALVERNVTNAAVITRAGGQKPLSGCCRAPLDGKAAMWCTACGKSIPAAAINHEVHAPGGAR